MAFSLLIYILTENKGKYYVVVKEVILTLQEDDITKHQQDVHRLKGQLPGITAAVETTFSAISFFLDKLQQLGIDSQTVLLNTNGK